MVHLAVIFLFLWWLVVWSFQVPDRVFCGLTDSLVRSARHCTMRIPISTRL